MTLYEAIYNRKSIRSFRNDKIEKEILEGMIAFYHNMEPLFPGIHTSIEILEDSERKRSGRFGGLLNAKAPYYLAAYSENKEKDEMNMGYIMHQLSLYLYSKGIGSCYQGMVRCKKVNVPGMHFVILMAFGYPKLSMKEEEEHEPNRLPMEELCVYKEKPRKWVKEILETARIAPSALNSQPWRFVVYENRIHVFSKRPVVSHTVLGRFNEFNFGAMLANVMVAAEQLWIETDLIKLDNITHISLPNNQYVISILMKR